jgi:CheY-like chemotaxis protein
MARILAVEDNAHNLELMTYLLQASGHSVIPAETGECGVTLARSARPDLVVLDIQLPDMDGYAVLTRLRADPDLAGLAIVAVTAYAMVGERDHAIAAGFDGYLSKPIVPSSFVQTIDTYLPESLRGHEPTATWATGPDPASTDVVLVAMNNDESSQNDSDQDPHHRRRAAAAGRPGEGAAVRRLRDLHRR